MWSTSFGAAVMAAVLFTSFCHTAAAGPAPAGPEVVSARNQGDRAAANFQFEKDVPKPSDSDAANRGTFKLVDGRRDPNGGNVAVLHDGRLPAHEDNPAANFFFAANTEGGRLLLDLGEPREVRQVNTYSWHRTNRGPQVYTLYGSDGLPAGFNAAPGKGVDPATVGWTKLTAVDARPPGGGALGGQYGVSVRNADGRPLGTYRYLLFDVSRTEADRFANTFFSEIDVIDGKQYPPAAPAVPPAPAEGLVTTVEVADKYEITFDVSEVPDLREWVDTKLKPACVEWYPKIVEMLPSEGYSAPERFKITFRRDMRGVAFTRGTDVECAADWFRQNLEGEAAGAVVHELVHVVQQYRRARGRNRAPGWMVEGLADYIRWFMYEPESVRPRPDPRRAKYTDSYRTTGAFLDYVARTHGENVIRDFNAAMREGRYADELWEKLTGKTVDALWAEYVRTLEAQPPQAQPREGEGKDKDEGPAAAAGGVGQFHVVPTPIKSYRLLAMSMDEDGCIWAGSTHRVIHRYDPRTGGVVQTVPLPYDAVACSCICAAGKVYVLGQSYPRMIIYDRAAGRFREAAYPSDRPDVWYGTEPVGGRYLYLFDRGGVGVIKWDTQTDTGTAIPYPYAKDTPLPSFGRYEAADRALWCPLWDYAGGQYRPVGIARLDAGTDRFTGYYPFPKDQDFPTLDPYTDPGVTVFLPHTLKGKLVPFDMKAARFCRPLDVPGFGESFGFIGGCTAYDGRLYFSVSTYDGDDAGCDGKPYHFLNGLLEFDPASRQFALRRLESEGAYYQIAYTLAAGGRFYATGSNIRPPDAPEGALDRDRAGEVIFWQSHPPDRSPP